jgi:hypothetical protein
MKEVAVILSFQINKSFNFNELEVVYCVFRLLKKYKNYSESDILGTGLIDENIFCSRFSHYVIFWAWHRVKE